MVVVFYEVFPFSVHKFNMPENESRFMGNLLRILIPVFTMASYKAPPKTVYNLIMGLSSYDVEVILVSAVVDEVFEFPEKCVIVNSLSKSKLDTLNNIIEISKLSEKVDLIYVPIALETLILTKISGSKPVIAGPNIGEIPYFKHSLTKILCDRYISYNKYLAQYLSRNNFEIEKVRIVPHAIDIDYYSPKRENREFWEKFNLGIDKNILLFVGRLEKKKGVLNLIRSFLRYIHPEYRESILVIISSGGSYEKQIADITRKHNCITFIKSLSERYMPVAYASADVGIFPSEQEGFGMVYLESMASGTPTIGVNSAGPSEIISNGHDGILIQDNSEKSIYEAVSYLLENDKVRKRIGHHGRKTIEKRYSPHVVAKRFLNVCFELIG